MSDAEHTQRVDKIWAVFESAFKIAGIDAAPNLRIKDRLDGATRVEISIPDGRNINFLVFADGLMLPILPDGRYSIGIGNLNDEQPANAPALRERIARRIRNAFANEA